MKILHDANMQEPIVGSFRGGTVAYYSEPAPGRLGANEDAALVDERGLLAVADGVGGSAGGERAAQHLVTLLAETPPERSGILDALERANTEIAALGVGACSTVAIVAIEEGRARSYHVGDSMILVVGQRGRRKLQAISHSPVGYAIEAGVLDEEEALHHDELHVVSNLVGTADMRIEVSTPIRLAPRDTVVIASDGLSDNLHMEEIVETVRKGPLEKAARRLAHEARTRMREPDGERPSKPDDLTFLLYRPTT
ncbi:MAG: serine/threonine-protein phosphatase [Planctomycetota bacterium]|nr:serine/threonine-protein phosphatase [Planctomycetota bacterium]